MGPNHITRAFRAHLEAWSSSQVLEQLFAVLPGTWARRRTEGLVLNIMTAVSHVGARGHRRTEGVVLNIMTAVSHVGARGHRRTDARCAQPQAQQWRAGGQSRLRLPARRRRPASGTGPGRAGRGS